jgi:integral membrane protein
MPIGVLINAASVLLGGIAGALAGHKLSPKFKAEISLIFGVCSMGMGISTIGLMKNMPAVIFAIIIGTALGLAIHLGDWIHKGATLMQKPISKIFKNNSNMSEEEFLNQLVTIIVLFCASGTGIYGSLTAGMTGDNSILISKSILDFFTAAIFACQLGYVVSVISVPQFIIFFILFLCAGFIYPMTSPDMIADFKACGGFLMLATGFRMVKLKNFPIADMIPAMILVMPLSYFWVTYIMALV